MVSGREAAPVNARLLKKGVDAVAERLGPIAARRPVIGLRAGDVRVIEPSVLRGDLADVDPIGMAVCFTPIATRVKPRAMHSPNPPTIDHSGILIQRFTMFPPNGDGAAPSSVR